MRIASCAIWATLTLHIGTALACSCPAREVWWDSSQPIVFLARVLSTEVTEQKYHGAAVVKARYAVTERFRGDPSTIEVLRTISGTTGGSCGIALTSGDEFLIHTDAKGWALECTGTQSYSPIRDESKIEKLRQARDQK